jgi:hypothetical protein
MEFHGGFQTGLFADTGSGTPAINKGNAGRSRQRLFAETRKPDEDDAGAHRRGAMTTYSADKIGATTGLFVNNAV